MRKCLQEFLDWSEIWALFIPLGVLFFKRKQPSFLIPVIVYLWLALFINTVIDILAQYNLGKSDEDLISNTYLYNIHSIVRFACFSYFFISLKQAYFNKVKKLLPLLSFIFIILNFTLVTGEDFFNLDKLSGNLLSAEAYLLLVYSMLFYLSSLKEEIEVITSGKDFWVVTGVSFYVVINFFVFLFYDPMIELANKYKDKLAEQMWNFHNIAYIILCIFIAKAFYGPIRN